MNKKVVIVGSGISGLAAAYWLKKSGYDVLVIDKNKAPGGVMESAFQNGFMFDKGPNSGLETSPLIKEIVDDLGLSDKFVYANDKGNKRYILRNNTLHALEMNPKKMIQSKLLSTSGKLRVLAEPFIGRSKDGYYQSISEFVSRRLGKEFLDYVINPFVAGVFAGNPDNLSVKSAFPKLYALEEKYGGLMVGTVKSIKERKRSAEKSKQSAKMFSFENGMQAFPKAIADYLGKDLELFSEVKCIKKENDKYTITYDNAGEIKTVTADVVISAIPAYMASEVFKDFDSTLVKHLNEVYYPPVIVLYLAYKKQSITQPLDGFGFLIPAKERKSFLGAIWSSVLFPKRADDDKASFTLFIGGARNPEIVSMDKELLFKKVINEFEDIMGITDKPVFNQYRYWPKAIPQYNIGYIEHERYFDEFEKKNPGLILSGNYRGGISVGDCIKNSKLVFEKVEKILKK
ncbi:MAG TPA: protoporphyrinogen oxidase [Ignavibacteriaceae bacterium]|nr:protoporphyrinogen oxidase [Ignavibacteriaceae bacterium]